MRSQRSIIKKQGKEKEKEKEWPAKKASDIEESVCNVYTKKRKINMEYIYIYILLREEERQRRNIWILSWKLL